MKIAFLNTSRSWGGGEKWHFNAAVAMQQRGWPVVVFCHPDGALAEKARAAGLATVPFQVSNLSFLNPLKVLALKSLLLQQEIGCLLLNSPAEVKLGGLAGRLAKLKQIVFRRGMPHPISNSWVNRFLFRECIDTVIANSQEVARSLNKANPDMVAQDKIRIIHNGIDFDELDQRPATPLAGRDDTGLVVLGTAGRFVRQKNFKALLDVATTLKARDVPFRLLIAGTGELEQELHQYCQQQGLQDKVEFTGFVHNIKDLLCAIDVFVFTSIYEGSSNAVIEASAMALPVVAFEIESNTEIVEHGKQGLLSRVNDIDTMADHCQALIEDPERRVQMGRDGRANIAQHFTAEHNWQKLHDLLSDA